MTEIPKHASSTIGRVSSVIRLPTPSAGLFLLTVGLVSLSIQDLASQGHALQAEAQPHYDAIACILAALLLAWFRGWAADRLVWVVGNTYRWISAALCSLAMGVEGFMHASGVSHIEGWWIPVLGSGLRLDESATLDADRLICSIRYAEQKSVFHLRPLHRRDSVRKRFGFKF